MEQDTNMITEQNMREFFERVVSNFVGLSEQARQVEALTQRVNDMSDRISSLEQENYNLKTDLQAQIERASQVQAQHDATQLELNNAREHAHALAETIISRDTRVSDLERQVSDANNSVATMDHELSVRQNRINDLEALAQDLQTQLDQRTNERDNSQIEAQALTVSNRELQASLQRINSILNPPRPVEDYVSNVA